MPIIGGGGVVAHQVVTDVAANVAANHTLSRGCGPLYVVEGEDSPCAIEGDCPLFVVVHMVCLQVAACACSRGR